MSQDILKKIQEVVSENLSVDIEKVIPSANFIDDLGADSLDIVELVMALEEEFGIEIPDSAAEDIKTVEDALNFIQKEQKKSA
jgi:acyl carrier protein